MVDRLIERWPLLFFAPGAEMIVALLVGVLALVVARPALLRTRTGAVSVPPVLRVTAGAVVVVWAVDLTARSLWVRFPDVAWWIFAAPLLVAAGGIVAYAMRGSGRSRRAGEPVAVGERRGWASFSSRSALWVAGVLALLVVLLTVVAGALSSPDDNGSYTLLDSGNAGVASFYGWAYGVPALAGAGALVGATVLALARVAAPPFRHADSLPEERRTRRVTSNAVLTLASATLAVVLGEALRVVGRAGASSAGVGIPGVGEFQWSPGFSSFAEVCQWGGWGIQVLAFVALFALVLGLPLLDLPARRAADPRPLPAAAR